MPGIIGKRFAPPKLKPFLGLRNEAIAILDVGCGNHSPTMTKYWFPRSSYYGLDVQVYNNDENDLSAMSGFYQCDLQKGDLSILPDCSFDVIIMGHVIEHLTNGEQVIAALATKLKPGGQLYIECPSERSLRLPSAVDSLCFYDDPSHLRLYSLKELTRACEEAGLVVLRSSLRRDTTWAILGILMAWKHVSALIHHGKLYGPALWDLLGFAHFVLAERQVAISSTVSHAKLSGVSSR